MVSAALDTLLNHPALWRGGELARVARPSVPTGHEALDRELPGGGWPAGALTELLHDRVGVGELSLLAPMLARLTQAGRWVAWVAPPHRPYAPALAAAGIRLARLWVITPASARDALWAAEQALASGSVAAVLSWPGEIDARAARRLQLAAEAGGSLGFLYRPLRAAAETSPAALRLALEPAASPSPGELALRILKRRGAAGNATLRVSCAA